eukprot:CAMPEP_0201165682 /NCGR_PEP_ID=MMETSP0851-20130426/64685_1 /ASSEMBLY_ACC=CAM_ASM_000631 /TAXON_ID=183588 /ORGANISM="Pseudo-nitzschia fraudulenta, Strain WWA7" /LENGTH=46 /DNA_ID= /DNA_START= /DNA_END= /DNA_ORIENTATION=
MVKKKRSISRRRKKATTTTTNKGEQEHVGAKRPKIEAAVSDAKNRL